MKIIDIHTHIYLDDIAQKVTDSARNFYQIGGGGMNGTVHAAMEDLLEITCAVISTFCAFWKKL